jgi:hypothetical protein
VEQHPYVQIMKLNEGQTYAQEEAVQAQSNQAKDSLLNKDSRQHQISEEHQCNQGTCTQWRQRGLGLSSDCRYRSTISQGRQNQVRADRRLSDRGKRCSIVLLDIFARKKDVFGHE